MNDSPGTTLLAALLAGGAAGSVSWLPAAIAALLLAAGLLLAARRAWPLSARRALLFFFLLSLVAGGARLLPATALDAARPGLIVAARILLWAGLVECLQGLLLDLALCGWLRRPPVPRILRDLATLAIALTVLLMSLRSTLGVNLASLLATSAMISVVLGLALQETLGGLFAGLALQMEAPLAVGDWIQVGERTGRVSQVGWRTVRLVDLQGDEITLPNSLVARSTLVNYSRPGRAHRHHLDVRVPFRHPAHEVLAAIAAAPCGVAGVLADPPPHALLWEYGESGAVYRARWWIEEYARADQIRGEVGARLWYALRRAGIEPAHPVRVVSPAPAAPDVQALGRRAEEALAGVDLFAPLAAQERRLIAQSLRPLLFGRGERIIRQGEPGDSFFVVTRGSVEVRVEAAGEESVVGTLGAGSFFGEMSLLAGGARTATVVAREDAEVFAVTREDFRRVVAGHPEVLEEVTRIVAGRRGELAEALRETEQTAAARAAAHRDLLARVRSFFGV